MSKEIVPVGVAFARDALERKYRADAQKAGASAQATKIAGLGSTLERVRAIHKWVHANVSRLSIGGYGDADDIAVALGALCEAAGIDTRLVLEEQGEHCWTVHVEAKLESGDWWKHP